MCLLLLVTASQAVSLGCAMARSLSPDQLIMSLLHRHELCCQPVYFAQINNCRCWHPVGLSRL